MNDAKAPPIRDLANAYSAAASISTASIPARREASMASAVSIDHNEIGWNLHWSDLAGRRDADEKMATGGEKLLGDQNRKCRADSTTHNAAIDRCRCATRR